MPSYLSDFRKAAGVISGHPFIPPWKTPTVDDAMCALGHCPATAAKEIATEPTDPDAARQAQEDLKPGPDGPPGWPYGVKPYDKAKWTAKDVAELRRKLPGYKIKGPGYRAVCYGEGMLVGDALRLIEQRQGVKTVEEAAEICDKMKDCTHFFVFVGPAYPHIEVGRKGVPYRADFCRGGKVTAVPYPHTHTFVGIKRSLGRDLPLPPPDERWDGSVPGFKDGPIEARGTRGSAAKKEPEEAEEAEKTEAELRVELKAEEAEARRAAKAELAKARNLRKDELADLQKTKVAEACLPLAFVRSSRRQRVPKAGALRDAMLSAFL